MGTEGTIVLAAQMRRQQCDTPDRRPVPQTEGIAAQSLEDLGGGNLGRSDRTATPRGIRQDRHLMARQIALEPVVDRLSTDTRQLGDLADSGPLGDPQHGLHALKEADVCHTL
jgi:hypothetical protein